MFGGDPGFCACCAGKDSSDACRIIKGCCGGACSTCGRRAYGGDCTNKNSGGDDEKCLDCLEKSYGEDPKDYSCHKVANKHRDWTCPCCRGTEEYEDPREAKLCNQVKECCPETCSKECGSGSRSSY